MATPIDDRSRVSFAEGETTMKDEENYIKNNRDWESTAGNQREVRDPQEDLERTTSNEFEAKRRDDAAMETRKWAAANSLRKKFLFVSRRSSLVFMDAQTRFNSHIEGEEP
jgi:hypothetical protein